MSEQRSQYFHLELQESLDNLEDAILRGVYDQRLKSLSVGMIVVEISTELAVENFDVNRAWTVRHASPYMEAKPESPRSSMFFAGEPAPTPSKPEYDIAEVAINYTGSRDNLTKILSSHSSTKDQDYSVNGSEVVVRSSIYHSPGDTGKTASAIAANYISVLQNGHDSITKHNAFLEERSRKWLEARKAKLEQFREHFEQANSQRN